VGAQPPPATLRPSRVSSSVAKQATKHNHPSQMPRFCWLLLWRCASVLAWHKVRVAVGLSVEQQLPSMRLPVASHVLPPHALCFAASQPARRLLQTTALPGGACGPAVCPSGQCCSQFGYCVMTSDHCGITCQAAFSARDNACAAAADSTTSTTDPLPTTSNPSPPVSVNPSTPAASGSGVAGLISAQQWEQLFPNRNNPNCASKVQCMCKSTHGAPV
jgi:hypothetical protein